MFSFKSRVWLRIISASVFVLLPLAIAPAQDDPDPNSPTPILLSENDSTRALAVPAGKTRAGELPRSSSRIFWPDQKIELFVTNLALMEGEAANAFRVYIKDAKGREYRFPVLEIRALESLPNVFAVVTRLTDEVR